MKKRGARPKNWIDKKSQMQINIENRLINQLAPKQLSNEDKVLHVYNLLNKKQVEIFNFLQSLEN